MSAFFAGAAHAQSQSEIVGPEAFDGSLDLRAAIVGGETGWLEGGNGKLRFGGDDGEDAARLRVASADLAWKPQFSFSLSGLVSVTRQDGQSNDLDINEAFLKWRSGPGPMRVSARAGVMWPPISQEHGGSFWHVEDSITPSAVNSWIGEEVKVLALETAVERQVGEHEVKLTAAGFLHNDMAGTAMTYRGWALHDFRITMHGDLPLPPLPPSAQPFQDDITTSFWEVDHEPGYYARLDWTPPVPVTLNLFRYDNFGDRVSTREMQTSWRTRFWNLGAMASLGDKTEAKAQVLWGNTLVGPDTPFGIPADVDFAAAYLLVGRTVGDGKLSVRADWFEATDNSFIETSNNEEYGWSAMVAYKYPLRRFADLFVEAIHVDSDRPARALYAATAADQAQTMLQTSLRLHF